MGYLKKVDHPVVGTGPVEGLQEGMQVARKYQRSAALRALEESVREIDILKLPRPLATVVVLVN